MRVNRVTGIVIVVLISITGIVPFAAIGEVREGYTLDNFDYVVGTSNQVEYDATYGYSNGDSIILRDGGGVGWNFGDFSSMKLNFWIRMNKDHNKLWCIVAEKGTSNKVVLEIECTGKWHTKLKVMDYAKLEDGEPKEMGAENWNTGARNRWANIVFEITKLKDSNLPKSSFSCYVKCDSEDYVCSIEDNSGVVQMYARHFNNIELITHGDIDDKIIIDDVRATAATEEGVTLDPSVNIVNTETTTGKVLIFLLVLGIVVIVLQLDLIPFDNGGKNERID